jgi:imidazolonepropionase-like amidohydrolase
MLAARAVFPARKLGRLEPGFEASLLALACDPIVDFACTKQITLRMKQGRVRWVGGGRVYGSLLERILTAS